MTRPKRDPYLEVGTRTRHAIDTAIATDATARQLRTLLAVIHYTTTWSLFGGPVYLGQLASVVYGVDRSEEWQQRKVREDLAALRAAGVLEVRAPRGRPSKPSYWVGLPDPSAPRNEGEHSAPRNQGVQDAQRTLGTGSATHTPDPSQRTPKPGASAPRNRRAVPPPAHPENGPPTEGFPEDVVRGEEPEGAGAGPTGTASGGPSADPDDGWDEEDDLAGADRLTKTLLNLVPDDGDIAPHIEDFTLIDRWLHDHAPDLRNLIAARLANEQLDIGDVRLAMRTARAVTDELGRHLPRLHLPRRSTT